ncbi:MAG: hypothetical protein AAB908_02610, partial [Patescibacteria group bacterium]
MEYSKGAFTLCKITFQGVLWLPHRLPKKGNVPPQPAMGSKATRDPHIATRYRINTVVIFYEHKKQRESILI